jgi:hypothetical protein
MRYNSTLGNPKSNPSVMPPGNTTNLGLMGDTSMQTPQIAVPRPAFNPGIKPSGAPVNFNPKAQANITGMFGMPSDGTYDRSLGMDPAQIM